MIDPGGSGEQWRAFVAGWGCCCVVWVGVKVVLDWWEKKGK